MSNVASLAGYRPQPSGEAVTEDSAALLFRERHNGQTLFDHDASAWFVWKGTHWQRERTGLAFDWARNLARDLAREGSSR